MPPLKSVLIANRGEIAVRIVRACVKRKITSYAVFSEEDGDAMHVRLADHAVALGGSGPRSYLNRSRIVSICKEYGINAVIPGYGFLSEDAEFARLLEESGILFIGPSPEVLVKFGLKHEARALAEAAKVPIVPGSEIVTTTDEAMKEAARIGYPIMVKATAGGGGMGLQICRTSQELEAAVSLVRSRGEALFQNSGMFLERYIENGRHIEGQIFGNGQGDILWFGERECSIQRRHQKVLEEAPSPYVLRNPHLRQRLKEASVSLAASVKYKSAGTVEYLVDDDTGDFYFLEMNTRLQVEHGVSELAYDIDLVDLMLLQASAELEGKQGLSKDQIQQLKRDDPYCHAIEVRVYAELPAKNFIPAPGLLQHVNFPVGPGIRVDSWIETGVTVSPSFDPLLAKIIVHRSTRKEALNLLAEVLAKTEIFGPPTNIDYLEAIIAHPLTVSGDTTTNMLEKKLTYSPCAIELLDGGTYTTIQDYPGRIDIPNGVPPAGSMDSVSFRIANLLVGNHVGVEGIEITLRGPRIHFFAAAVIALCGANTNISINSERANMWTRHVVPANSTVEIGDVQGPGSRAYLAILGGLPKVASYLGSKSTTPNLNWGGYQGRTLRTGDFLFLDPESCGQAKQIRSYSLPEALHPTFENSPTLFTMPGPYDSDDFVTPQGRERFYATEWKVSPNSNRGGIRLDGPSPEWSRRNGGEGGSHPSNVMGYGYPVGGLSFTGDSAVVFPFDAPVQSGFVCLHTIISADLWRLGQLRPGGTVKFSRCSWSQARALETRLDNYLSEVKNAISENLRQSTFAWDWRLSDGSSENAILYERPQTLSVGTSRMILRQAGDRAILCEFGNQSFDLKDRGRLQQLLLKLQEDPPFGLKKLSRPHTCSLLIYFNPNQIDQHTAIDVIRDLERALPVAETSKIRSRIHHLPLLFDAKECDDATKRYMQTQRPYATYLPDNIDFIRRSNGLQQRLDVLKMMSQVPQLLITSGRLPIFIQVDPRLRLSVPKMNPSRTFTPSGAVGTGGMTSSIYPADAPGGYMLWGMTLPGCPWDTYGRRPGFSVDRPWLFESFDQIVFHPVCRQEYDELAQKFRAGIYHIHSEESSFDLAAYIQLVNDTREEVAQLRQSRAECERIESEKEELLLLKWQAEKAKQAQLMAEKKSTGSIAVDAIQVKVEAPLHANVWKIEVEAGQSIRGGEQVIVLEAMKLEVSVKAPGSNSSFTVVHVVASEGEAVHQGELLLILEPSP